MAGEIRGTRKRRGKQLKQRSPLLRKAYSTPRCWRERASSAPPAEVLAMANDREWLAGELFKMDVTVALQLLRTLDRIG